MEARYAWLDEARDMAELLRGSPEGLIDVRLDARCAVACWSALPRALGGDLSVGPDAGAYRLRGSATGHPADASTSQTIGLAMILAHEWRHPADTQFEYGSRDQHSILVDGMSSSEWCQLSPGERAAAREGYAMQRMNLVREALGLPPRQSYFQQTFGEGGEWVWRRPR